MAVPFRSHTTQPAASTFGRSAYQAGARRIVASDASKRTCVATSEPDGSRRGTASAVPRARLTTIARVAPCKITTYGGEAVRGIGAHVADIEGQANLNVNGTDGRGDDQVHGPRIR
jgi:hypothetical protein